MGEIPRADPASTARIQKSGEAGRDNAIFFVTGGFPQWEVTVTPLPGVTLQGKAIDGAAGDRGQAFEVRTESVGEGREEFGPSGHDRVTMVDTALIESAERARAIAMCAVDELRAGRSPDLVVIARRF